MTYSAGEGPGARRALPATPATNTHREAERIRSYELLVEAVAPAHV